MPLSKPARIGLAFLPVVIILGVFLGIPLWDQLPHNGVRGHFIDAVYVPETGKLWFQTDGSFYYASTVVTPGSYEMSTKSLFNKIYTYGYDPVGKKVVSETKQTFSTTPPQAKWFHVPAGILGVSETISGPGNLELRDPNSFAVIRDFAGFQSKFPELASGLADMHIVRDEDWGTYLRITTRDGHDLVYDIATDRLYNGVAELEKGVKADAPKTVTRYALSSTDARLGLYKLTGPSSELVGEALLNLYDPSVVKAQYVSEVTRLAPDQAFLEGQIVYQDDSMVVVLSQDQIGKNSDRRLTAVGADGKGLWTVPQSQLFPEVALRESDDGSDMFFLKDKLHASKEGDLFIFKMDDVGVQAFDVKTGEKKWEFKKP